MFNNYEKLNEYLKDICTYLQKKNPYLLNNICKITTLSGTVLNLLRDFNFDVNMRENNLSIQDVESMARAIIEKMNKDYLELFDRLVESGELRFCDNEKFVGSDVCLHIEDDGKITKMVSIERKHNYSDVRILVHEFIHYTTCECFSINREILAEFLAIYCYKFLKLEDIIKLNDNIDKYDNLTIEEILQKLGIDLYDKNFANRMKEAFKE